VVVAVELRPPPHICSFPVFGRARPAERPAGRL